MNFCERIVQPYKEQVLQKDGYFVWCGSVIDDEKGKYHMFASMWETEKTFSSWVTQSKIVRAESDKPEGPFSIKEELVALNQQEWSRKMAHNPTVKKINGKYYLFYIGTTYPDDVPSIPEKVEVHPARCNQRIGVAIADSPEGPWVPSSKNPVLEPGTEGSWDSTFVTNPSVFIEEGGEVRMIYKSRHATTKNNLLILGLAVSNDPEGPYKRKDPSPLFEHDVEDPFVWRENGKYWMVLKDMTGILVGKYNGALFESEDGHNWELAENKLAWDHKIIWQDDGIEECPPHMERPQLLLDENGKPICFYTAIGDFNSFSYNLARKIK